MAETQKFANISLGGRGGANQGSLKVSENGLQWKGATGGKTVEVPQADIEGFTWTKVKGSCLLGVKRKGSPVLQFTGFKDNDMDALRELSDNALSTSFEKEELSTSGRTWGQAALEGPTLAFRVGASTAFRVPLPDVTQVQHGRDEVILEFPVDDAGGANGREDSLAEMAFHVPRGCTQYKATADGTAPAKVFYDALMAHADVDTATGDAVATFESVSVDTPRGRFDVEMYPGFVKLVGQAQDYRIQYDSIVRIFVLPKTNTPQTLVVVSLDPPIRKGQTHYAHLMALFPNDEEMSIELDIADDALQAKNTKCGGKLQRSMSGPAYEVFARVLRGLSGAKLTKPGAFRAADGESYAIRASYKAAAGDLYPLERAFFFASKPPVLLVYDEVESAEFQRQGGGMLGASAKTFDLMVRMASGSEYVFHTLQKSEWQNLFSWMEAKKLPLENVAQAKHGPGMPGGAVDLGQDFDAGLAGMGAKGELDSEEDDEDFDAGGEDSADSDDDNSDVSGKAPAKKKARKKKDKDAPKGALSAYMFFSGANRERIKAAHPEGIKITEISKLLGEEWKKITPEDKLQYEEMAAKDKERYGAEMATYKAGKAAAAASADAADSDDAGGDASE